MAAGIQLGNGDINGVVGGAARELNSLMDRIGLLYTWYAAVGASGLQNTYGFTAADAATLGSALTDMHTLAQIYLGAQAQGTTAYDFRTFVKQIDGFGF